MIKNKKKISKKISELDNLKQKCIDLENNWKRAVADYQNLKKRSEEERLAFVKYANKELLLDLLLACDNFEEATKHSNDTNFNVSISFFKDLLKRHGVEEINILNKDFDQALCEAIETVPGETNKVIEVLTKGYTLNGLLLRPARVKVGKKD